MDELRGKILITLHGNWLDNEYDVFEYSYKEGYYARGIRDAMAFTMAGAVGRGSEGHECSDEGRPDGAHRGNVCNFTPLERGDGRGNPVQKHLNGQFAASSGPVRRGGPTQE